MKTELREETRFELYVFFRDGRKLMLTDTLKEIYNYIESFANNIDYLYLNRLD